MIEIMPETYVLGFWYFTFNVGRQGDWMACAYREKEGGPWTLKYRFRYYVTADPWDKKDDKHWYTAQISEPEDRFLRKIDLFAAAAAAVSGSVVDRTICKVVGPDAFKKIEGKDWFHMKIAKSREEANG